MKNFFLKILIFFFFVNLFLPQYLNSANKTYKEDEIIAAFLYNIAKFITWNSKKKDIFLYVVGSKAIEKYFYKLNGKKINKLKIKVIFSKNIQEIKNADILYIDKTYQNFEKILFPLKNHKIFTASNIKGFAKRLGILEFYKNKKYIRFKINIKNLKKTGLFLGSEVLELAKIVE